MRLETQTGGYVIVVMVALLLLTIGGLCVALVVQAIRQNRNDDRLESSDAPALEKSEGDSTGTDRGDAFWCAQARVSVELDGTFI